MRSPRHVLHDEREQLHSQKLWLSLTAMGEIIKTGLLLGMLASTIPSMAAAPVVSLGDMARSGMLLVEAVRDAGRRDKVLEIVALGCVVTFKTRIDASSFTARVIDLGSGSVIERERDRIRLLGSPRFSDTLIVHAGDQTPQLFDALQSVQSTCQAETTIF